jgi:hypothetical protein
LLVVVLATLSLTASGCAGLAQHVATVWTGLSVRAQERQDIAEFRRKTHEDLAEQRQEALHAQAERETEQARLDLEQEQLEQEFCLAGKEAMREQLQSQVREKIQSKIAFNVTQSLEVGELEVDVEELKRLIKEREEMPPPEQFQGGPAQKGCACGERECGCRPGLLRKHCPECAQKSCGCESQGKGEAGCGGPEALRQALQNPVRQPLRPTEIPLKLPVRLAFGMQNPQVEEARIRKEPITEGFPPQEEFQGPYQKHPSAQKQDVAANIQDSPDESARSARRTPTLPAPEPDTETR